MSMDLDALLSGQRDIYGRISRTVDNLKKLGSANVTRSHVEIRINILDQLWAKFENQHELIRTSYKDKFNDCEYAKTDFVDTTESMYVQQRSTLAEYLNTFRTAAERSESLLDQTTDRAPKTSLPRIKLQQFSGAYEEWPTFRDLFLSVIGENQSISNIERFHYLRSCLQGPAEKLIRPLTVTGENYDRAWAILSKQYENKRELIRSNFSTFTAVTKMKGESAEELSRILNAVMTAVNAQESIGRPIESHGMDLLNHFVVELFDPRTRLEWESSLSDSTDPPEHEALVNFITKRILTLNAAKPKSSKNAAKDSSQSARTHVAKRGSESPRCPLCKEQHSVMLCNDFKSKTAAERRSVVETHRLCFNCLGNHLVARCQSKKNCFTCNARHHTMLHEAVASPGTSEASSLSAARQNQGHKAVLLATARVNIADRYGNPHIVRALIDQGSEVSLISEALAQSLHLSRTRSAVTIFGVGEAHSGSTRGKVKLNLTSLVTGETLSAVAFVLPRLSFYRGAATKCKTSWPHIQGLPLADPEYWAGDRIELLLGAEVCSIILEDGVRRSTPHTPLAQKTTLGWILSGGCGGMAPRGPRSSVQCSADSELNELVRHFWEQEKEQPISFPLTPQEEECENFFVRTHGRTATGRYVVRLPFSATPTTLAETRQPALRVLSSMERKFERDPQFGELYRTFMQEFEDLQHMEVIPASSATKPQVCYLPHHGVLRETSTTTKLRVVFNGSQRTISSESLNSHLLIGANLLPALADVLLRWRWHRYALVADIEKMYRQILVHPDDRDYQRILWRPTDAKEVRDYRLNTVTYGLACAPFLAIRSVRQLANDEKSRFPLGAAVLLRDCYVDDIVTGANTLSDAVAVQTELRNLCMAGGFLLRKWAANNSEILTGIPPDHRLTKTSCEWRHESHSTLGLRWHPVKDSFAFVIHPRTITEYTKRRVLAETARLFDPLGWLAPVVIRAKIWIQSAWLRQLEWDEPLPEEDHRNWHRFLNELPELERVRVKRWLGSNASSAQAELHGFADASERGYAAVIYLRVSHDDIFSLHLIKAKSKVAPVKQVSLPRLELCAANLLADLANYVRSSLNMSTAPVHLWSDSKVTLHWIHGHASRWKTYVANRVAHIQTQLPDAQWHHVPGPDNPADCASRGIAPGELINHPLWWTGPRWLSESSALWPKEKHQLPEAHVLEQRLYTLTATNIIEAEPEFLLRFSSLHRLLRELDEDLFRWLSALQTLHYAGEVAALRKGLTVPHRSTLRKLSPFVDENGVMRVGGRLKHALLAHDEKYPMIVPPSSWMTRLIVEAYHRRTLHGGVQLTLGSLRLRFWIPRGRAVVKHMIHRCVVCTRWRAAKPQPSMGNLPPGRVTPARPFWRTGVDYAGPILVRTSKGRAPRLVHLEVASDYTTEAFLAAFRRFVARRGLCKEVYSDCGTNFVGADRALRELFRAATPNGRRLAKTIADEGIKWHFNPPAAPHFGGLWEAAVKSLKHHLRRVIGDTTLTFEEMSTFLCQVESCLNSRPLQALSDDPNDIAALTPGHFLIGAPLLAVPEPSLSERAETTLSRWQHLQRMRDHFWQRWSREYIHGLESRPKWTKGDVAPSKGALCLVRSENTPPNRWPLARITQLHPGDDDVVRVVTVRTAASELIRPIIKLVMLPGVTGAPSSPTDA